MGKAKFLEEQRDYLKHIKSFIRTKDPIEFDKLTDEFDLFLVDLNFEENVRKLLSAELPSSKAYEEVNVDELGSELINFSA